MFHVKRRRVRRLAPLAFVMLLVLPLLAACGLTDEPDGWAAPVPLPAGDAASAVVVIAAGTGELVAVDLDSLRVRWRFPDDDDRFPGLLDEVKVGGFYGTPARLGADELVVGTYDDGKVYAVRSDGSSARLLFDTEARVVAGAVVDGATVYIADTDGRVHAVDSENPDRTRLLTEIDQEVWGTPVLADSDRHGRLLLVAALDGTLRAIRVEDGGEAWRFEAGAGLAGSAVVADGWVYIGGMDRAFYALDIETGDQLWRNEGANWFWSAAVVEGGTVYVADLDGFVWAWEAKSGEPLWSQPYRSDGQIRARPVLLPDGTALVVVTRDGRIHAIDPRSGARLRRSLKESAKVIEKVYADPLLREGVLLISNDDGELFRVRVGDFNTERLYRDS